MEKSKKLKAAIAGVMQYLKQEEDQKKQKQTNKWVMAGRKIMMRNRELVQRRGCVR